MAGMNDARTELLKKARKGAWASFTVAGWEEVLAACGFNVSRTGRGPDATVTVTAPNGVVVVVKKNPTYRALDMGWFRVPGVHASTGWDGEEKECKCGEMWPCAGGEPFTSYTSIHDWAASQGVDLKVEAARVLGVPTVEEERAQKEYKARDWTHTGTCGICYQNVKMEDGGARQVLVLHGFRRPGHGATEGQCFGRGYAPYELSPQVCKDYLALVVETDLARQRTYLEDLLADKVDEISDPVRTAWAPVKKGEAMWSRAVEREKALTERKIAALLAEQALFQRRVESWKLADLPEVVMARRFGK
jgi:hypothetical protein